MIKETQELLDHLLGKLRVDVESGKIYWLARVPVELKDRQWNGRFAGKEAGTLRKDGYRRIGTVYGDKTVYVLNHRLVWAVARGTWPTSDIDHENQKKADNRLDNLREASRAQNIANRRKVILWVLRAYGMTRAMVLFKPG